MRRFWFSPNIVGNGILWLVGLAMQISGWVSPTVAYGLFGVAFIWSLCTLVYWLKNKGKKQLEIAKETKADDLTNILTNMHKRMWHLKSERARQRFDKKKFEDGAPVLLDKLRLIELKDWPTFKRKLRRRLKRQIPKSLERRRNKLWRYKVVSEAKEIISELVGSRQWQISDAVIIGTHLDSLHMGLGKLRDQDKQWQDLFEKTKSYMGDRVSRQLIDKHMSCSYALCSMSLGINYASKLPPNSTSQLLYSALVGSDIAPHKIEVALAEILEEITNRIKQAQPRENWIDAYKARHGKLPPLPNYLLPAVENYSRGKPISKDVKLKTPSGQLWDSWTSTQQENWRQLVEWRGENPEDYLDHMRRMLPQTPSGVERIRYRPHDQH